MFYCVIMRVYIILYLTNACNGIAEEYYDNTNVLNDSSQNEVKLLEINRRLGLLPNNVSAENIHPSNEEQDEVMTLEDLKIYVMTKRNSNWSTTNSMTADTSINDSVLPSTVMPSSIRPIDFFKDDEYELNDLHVTPSHRRYHHLLRGGTKNVDSSKNNTLPLRSTNNSFIADVEKDVKGSFTNYFSLEPAADVVKSYIENISDEIHISQETWYVGERSACWELPILYGEKGRGNKVFALYGSKLRNVIDLGKPVVIPAETFYMPISQPRNKWCGLEPCYGDHTLCLFPYYRLSKICDSDYKVLAPTMSEVIALVNTVNSMRNRVASGETTEYPNLPPAANMQQIIYDYDLESIAEAWLRQCLPGPAPCSALDGAQVTSLECTKYADKCCLDDTVRSSDPVKCIPRSECSVSPIIGCIHVWFLSANQDLDRRDVECGHTESTTYPTTQLIWADTYKIGCAYGVKNNADVRVVCNFAPGATFLLDVTHYCGFINYEESFNVGRNNADITDLKMLAKLGLELKEQPNFDLSYNLSNERNIRNEVNESISMIYDQQELMNLIRDYHNRTRGMVVRLVTKYKFIEETDSRCDTNVPMYIVGEPGSQCVERGRRYHDLCYDFRDPTPGYRLIAVLAPILLFSVILYDLFSGVVRQSNC